MGVVDARRPRHSSASSFAAMPVESTKSPNITVTCRRSPVASVGGGAIGAGWGGSVVWRSLASTSGGKGRPARVPKTPISPGLRVGLGHVSRKAETACDLRLCHAACGSHVQRDVRYPALAGRIRLRPPRRGFTGARSPRGLRRSRARDQGPDLPQVSGPGYRANSQS
jgi:hypothetical protein